MSCLYILKINPLLITSFANIFSQSVGCLFVLFMVSFVVQKLLSLIRSCLFIFWGGLGFSDPYFTDSLTPRRQALRRYEDRKSVV